MRRMFFIAGLLLTSPLLQADELDNLDALSQEGFELLAEDLAGVMAYRAIQPAEPFGTIGFDVGVEAGAIKLENTTAWETAGVDASTLPTFRVSATKGLPLNFDVGGFIATWPGSGLRGTGLQLRYALLEGGVATPAIGLRAAVTRLDGVDDLSLDTRSLDVSISKGFGPLTPYAGYGRVWADADPATSTGLAGSDIAIDHAFAGVRMTFVVLQLALEADRIGDTTGYSVKLAFGF